MEVTGSRQLLGPSLWLDGPGAVADVRLVEGDPDPVLAWREALKRANAALGWPRRVHSRRTGDDFVALAVEAPSDCLAGAARLNDWAVAGGREEELPSLVQQIAASSRPDLRTGIAQADQRGLPWLLDREGLTIGLGAGAVTVAHPPESPGGPASTRRDVARLDQVPWDEVHPVPVVLVTGTVGTAATARLLARIAGQAGHTVGLACSDGAGVGDSAFTTDDPTGPETVRLVVRDPRATFAILETPVESILEHGLVLPRVEVAVVTGIVGDPPGDHGVTTPQHLAETAVVVAKAARHLVLNADDPLLAGHEAGSWFSLEHRGDGAWVDDGELVCGETRVKTHQLRGLDRDAAGDHVTVLLAAAAAALAAGLPAGTIAGAIGRHDATPW
ncbi:MAG: Mur ligase family protein [Thermoanaerobaculaceae bacterium]|jgi:hypothetical protein|nr:Mur ligase family protein [Thermoanaerobaculaceae bacterium]